MNDHGERIAKLEAKMEIVESLANDVRQINERLSKYQGFIGGVVFLAGCFYYALVFGKEWLMKKFGG